MGRLPPRLAMMMVEFVSTTSLVGYDWPFVNFVMQ